jgi:hypothetical protein
MFEHDSAYSSVPVAVPQPARQQGVRPEFLRLPTPGKRCPITGLSRSALNELILGPRPPVASVCLRKRGAMRGIRLIVTESLLAYLHSQVPAAPHTEPGIVGQPQSQP